MWWCRVLTEIKSSEVIIPLGVYVHHVEAYDWQSFCTYSLADPKVGQTCKGTENPSEITLGQRLLTKELGMYPGESSSS
jgi:hypothetical protein